MDGLTFACIAPTYFPFFLLVRFSQLMISLTPNSSFSFSSFCRGQALEPTHFYLEKPIAFYDIECLFCRGQALDVQVFHALTKYNVFQCPLGLELLRGWLVASVAIVRFQCPLGLIHHFYPDKKLSVFVVTEVCQCPLGLIHHFYNAQEILADCIRYVSMPSRAYTSFLPGISSSIREKRRMCQCPLGLIPHFYGTPSKT